MLGFGESGSTFGPWVWEQLQRAGARKSGANGRDVLTRFLSAVRLAEAVRSHWSIENPLRWDLHVTFDEDDLRPSNDRIPADRSILMRPSLVSPKRQGSPWRVTATKRERLDWDAADLEQVLATPQP